jgi:hypothetical protein
LWCLYTEKLCELDWPSFDVGWPAKGTFDLPTAYRVERVIMGQPGDPDQIPYILTWIEVLCEKPSWLQKCIKKSIVCSKVLLSTKPPKLSSSTRSEIKRLSYRMPHWMMIFPHHLHTPPTNLQDPSQVLSLPHTRNGSSYQPPEPRPLAEGPPSDPSAPVLPLWQTPGDGAPFMIYVLFSTTDLYNWK